jgi:hypothetical protein
LTWFRERLARKPTSESLLRQRWDGERPVRELNPSVSQIHETWRTALYLHRKGIRAQLPPELRKMLLRNPELLHEVVFLLAAIDGIYERADRELAQVKTEPEETFPARSRFEREDLV